MEQVPNRNAPAYGLESNSQVESPSDWSSPPSAVLEPCESSTLNIRSSLQSLSFKDKELPESEIQEQLLDLYFTYIHPWCPILHKHTILDKMVNKYCDEEDYIILHAIVATTMRFLTDSIPDEDKGKYRELSKEKVLLYGHSHSSVKVLQALVILTLDIVGSENGPSAWNILALITRSVIHLDLAVETTIVPDKTSNQTMRGVILPQQVSLIEKECRRRLFWMVYLLDRYTHIVTSFDFIIDETQIGRKLPTDDVHLDQIEEKKTKFFQIWQSDHELHNTENLGPFSFYIEAVHMLSLVHTFLKQQLDVTTQSGADEWQSGYRNLNDYLEKWRDAIPAEYGLASYINPTAIPTKILARRDDVGRVMLHAAYHT